MSVEVIKSGMADTFQDGGRFGYQHLGVNPNGAMDLTAMKVANALVGNEMNETVLELCFPASVLKFSTPAIIALSGADFAAELNETPVPINQAITVSAESELRFTRIVKGVFCYLAVRGGFQIQPWLNSGSTNVKAKSGGMIGRSLQKGDLIKLKEDLQTFSEAKILPWRTNVSELNNGSGMIRVVTGNEFNWLDEESKHKFSDNAFTITALRDRMGCRLKGEALKRNQNTELISTVATFGTIQLLPDGQLIILTADHQTTGGYPRIAQVIAADRSKVVQTSVGDNIQFQVVTLQEAEDLSWQQHKILKQIQVTCAARLQDFIRSVS